MREGAGSAVRQRWRLGARVIMSTSETPSDQDDDVGRLEQFESLLDAMQDLKAENGRLRGNFHNLQSLHTQLQVDFHELQVEKESVQTELIGREAHFSNTVDQLSGELDQSYRQFEEAKAHILTQAEAKVLEERLRNEIETPFLEQIKKLDDALSDKSAEVGRLWKASEELREEYANTKRRMENEAEAQLANYSALLEEFEESNARLGATYQGSDELRRLNSALETKAVELEHRCNGLAEEVMEQRELRSKAEAASQTQAAKLGERENAWREEEGRLVGELEASKRKIRHLESELDKGRRGQAELHTALMEGKEALLKSQSELEGLVMTRRMEEHESKSRAQKLRDDFAKEKEVLSEAVTTCERRLALQSAGHAKEMKEARDAHQTAMTQLQERYAKLEASAFEEARAFKSRATQLESRMRQTQSKCDKAEEDCARMQSTLRKAEDDNAGLKERAEDLRTEHERAKSELASLRGAHKQMARDLESQSDQYLQSASSAERLQKESRRLTLEYEQLEDRLRDVRRTSEAQLKARERELETTQRNFALERLALAKEYEERNKASMVGHSEAHAKLKTRALRLEQAHTKREREYTLLLVKIAEVEAENKELRMQLSYGLSDIPAGGARTNFGYFRSFTTDLLRSYDTLGGDEGGEMPAVVAAEG